MRELGEIKKENKASFLLKKKVIFAENVNIKTKVEFYNLTK